MADAICRPPFFRPSDFDLSPFDLTVALPCTSDVVASPLGLNIVWFFVFQLTMDTRLTETDRRTDVTRNAASYGTAA